MTLGKYVKGLRTSRKLPLTQQQVAAAAGMDDSLVSILESDRNVRFETLKAVCKKGLKVTDEEWQMARLLWLENQSEETVFKPSFTKIREAYEVKESHATQDFLEKVNAALLKNLHVLDQQGLRQEFLEIIQNPKLLGSLKQFHNVYRAFVPKGKGPKP